MFKKFKRLKNSNDLSAFFLSTSGECVSRSSGDIKAMLDKNVTGFGAHGRKTDLLFVGGKHELCSCEFKAQSAGSTKFQTQRLKNIRLNRAIVESNFKVLERRRQVIYMDFSGNTTCGKNQTLLASRFIAHSLTLFLIPKQ
jgi:hypothetical protein